MMNYGLHVVKDLWHILRPHVEEYEWEGCIDAEMHPPAGSMRKSSVGKPYESGYSEWTHKSYSSRE
jgi:hypothetical protein